MYRNLIIAGLLLGLSVVASAQDGRVISQAHELTLADFRAPATTNGGITFKACPTCEYITARVGPNTRYTLDGKDIRLVDLRNALRGIRDRESVYVTVLRHLETNTVKKIAVSRSE